MAEIIGGEYVPDHVVHRLVERMRRADFAVDDLGAALDAEARALLGDRLEETCRQLVRRYTRAGLIERVPGERAEHTMYRWVGGRW